MNARYYTDGVIVWKFEDGKRPVMRGVHQKAWMRSVFSSLATFLSDAIGVLEINTEAGEP